MKPEIQLNKVVVISGAGVSAESGLRTFRDSGGLWHTRSWEEVATPGAWMRDPKTVLDFYNERRAQAWDAQPNPAHLAISALESAYEVVVITQNVDELHERAGSSNVVHLHGQLAYVRGTSAAQRRYRIDGGAISIDQLCEDGTQLRPDIVWFGEDVQHLDLAKSHIASAAKVLVVGTSLTVFPAAGLVKAARFKAQKIAVALERPPLPSGFAFRQGKAGDIVPHIVDEWLRAANS